MLNSFRISLSWLWFKDIQNLRSKSVEFLYNLLIFLIFYLQFKNFRIPITSLLVLEKYFWVRILNIQSVHITGSKVPLILKWKLYLFYSYPNSKNNFITKESRSSAVFDFYPNKGRNNINYHWLLQFYYNQTKISKFWSFLVFIRTTKLLINNRNKLLRLRNFTFLYASLKESQK